MRSFQMVPAVVVAAASLFATACRTSWTQAPPAPNARHDYFVGYGESRNSGVAARNLALDDARSLVLRGGYSAAVLQSDSNSKGLQTTIERRLPSTMFGPSRITRERSETAPDGTHRHWVLLELDRSNGTGDRGVTTAPQSDSCNPGWTIDLPTGREHRFVAELGAGPTETTALDSARTRGEVVMLKAMYGEARHEERYAALTRDRTVLDATLERKLIAEGALSDIETASRSALCVTAYGYRVWTLQRMNRELFYRRLIQADTLAKGIFTPPEPSAR